MPKQPSPAALTAQITRRLTRLRKLAERDKIEGTTRIVFKGMNEIRWGIALAYLDGFNRSGHIVQVTPWLVCYLIFEQ